MTKDHAELRVGAHVLVQLGSELVTDVEQAILECVKNSYDADSPGCKIEVTTRETGSRVEEGTAAALSRFDHQAESVTAFITDDKGRRLSSPVEGEQLVQRHLNYVGRITIEDTGDGLTPDQLKNSWLVISQSAKRGTDGQRKAKTRRGRTPLGDKGLGRLGSMKLGDILLIETATSPDGPLATAQFRWADCESARTIDEIPVYTQELANNERFKGTRVSVLGLRDLHEWRRTKRALELTASLARLISPFETTSTFPVVVTIDGAETSLVTITSETLARAIAEFEFSWEMDEALGEPYLMATARFRKRLFMSRRSGDLKARTAAVFDIDGGKAFAESLKTAKQLKNFREKEISLDGTWFIAVKRKIWWKDLLPDNGGAVADPGPFKGAFYFFHLNAPESDNSDAATGVTVDPEVIKGMSGISILRDGFRVRSQGDWLGLSSGMTSGSTYNLRVENTIGYFTLTGENNYGLVEKSDREGFVDNAAYRGFLAVAQACRSFANDSLERARRSLDEYYKVLPVVQGAQVASTTSGSLDVVESGLRTAREAREVADGAANLQSEMKAIEQEVRRRGSSPESLQKALRVAQLAVEKIEIVREKLETKDFAELDLRKIRHEFEESGEREAYLLESAAVGLSARGLAHELRTHLTEIRQRTASIEKGIKKASVGSNVVPDLRAIRGACTAIGNAAALIDPMLPKTRSVKEPTQLKEFVAEYVKTREAFFHDIKVTIRGAGKTVRINRARLTQILDNLVRNSVYWLRRGEATGRLPRAKQIEIELTSFGFVISDSGPGVDPHYEETLFDIFVSAKPSKDKGQGLGLFIVKELLSLEGCDVELLPDRNPEGRRFRFSVNLSRIIKV